MFQLIEEVEDGKKSDSSIVVLLCCMADNNLFQCPYSRTRICSGILGDTGSRWWHIPLAQIGQAHIISRKYQKVIDTALSICLFSFAFLPPITLLSDLAL